MWGQFMWGQPPSAVRRAQPGQGNKVFHSVPAGTLLLHICTYINTLFIAFSMVCGKSRKTPDPGLATRACAKVKYPYKQAQRDSSILSGVVGREGSMHT
jgi:hypothetical protein